MADLGDMECGKCSRGKILPYTSDADSANKKLHYPAVRARLNRQRGSQKRAQCAVLLYCYPACSLRTVTLPSRRLRSTVRSVRVPRRSCLSRIANLLFVPTMALLQPTQRVPILLRAAAYKWRQMQENEEGEY